MKYVVSMMLVFMVACANATEIFPTGCAPIMVHEELLTLSAAKSTLVMIHNLSNTDLWITHPVKEPNSSAGWSSRLQAGNWSALALNKKSFALSCIESRPGHEQQAPCAGLIAACQWANVKMPKKQKGTFWAGEDMTLSALKAHVGSRGIILAAPAQ